MHRYALLSVFLMAAAFPLVAQSIISGPVVGGATSDGARIYYRTDAAADLKIELSTSENFSSAVSFSVTTAAANYFAAITDVSGLHPDTRYFYRVYIDEVLQADKGGKFRTFPEEGQPGYYRVVVGSCNYDNFRSGGGATSPDNYMNDVLFGSIEDFDPHVVLHLGDWNYPPSRFGANFNLDPQKRADAFSFRYDDYNFRNYIQPNFPIDYMYDDSYSYNGSAGWTYPVISTESLPDGGIRYRLIDVPFDPGIRTGNIEGYFDHFPGYDQVDTSGVHHSFRLGNIEFFIVDTRNSKDPVHAGFRYNDFLNIYEWQPPAEHSTLGAIQREWLLDGLRNSDADWKVVGSSVVFNRKLSDLMDIVLIGQLIDKSLIEYATAIAYMWPGYPKDMFALLDAVKQDSIDNVIILSGDTHSSMMDDGRNSGIPEVSSSGWAAGNEGYLNYTIDSILQVVGLPLSTRDFLWSGGGTGVGNSYIGDSYATLEFFGRDSLRTCVIDEFDQVLACQTLMWQGSTDTSDLTTYAYVPETRFRVLYPNPAKTSLRVDFDPAHLPTSETQIRLVDAGGRILMRNGDLAGENSVVLNVAYLPAGVYLLQMIEGREVETRRFVKH